MYEFMDEQMRNWRGGVLPLPKNKNGFP